MEANEFSPESSSNDRTRREMETGDIMMGAAISPRVPNPYRQDVFRLAHEAEELADNLNNIAVRLDQLSDHIQRSADHFREVINVRRREAAEISEHLQAIRVTLQGLDQPNLNHHQVPQDPPMVEENHVTPIVQEGPGSEDDWEFNDDGSTVGSSVDDDHDDLFDREDAIENAHACLVCGSEFGVNEAIYLNCGHGWCRDCLNSSARIALGNRNDYPARCCANTPDGIDISVLQNHLDEDILLRFATVYEEYSCKDPTFCFNPRCGAFISASKVETRRPSSQWATCQHCSKTTCIECKGDKDLHPSPDQHLDLLSKEDRELSEKQGWKQCPNPSCRKMIERIDGCDHMRCQCGTNFCYRCGRPLTHSGNLTDLACNCEGQNPWVEGVQQW